MVSCRFCEKQYSSLGIKMHEKFCTLNPNRSLTHSGGRKKGSTPWNKGKTLSDEHRASIVKSLTGVSTGRSSSEDGEKLRREKISATMKSNPQAGGLRQGSGRGVKSWYESPIAGKVYLRSTYELEYVKFLDEKGISWIANIQSFRYLFNGEEHSYYPDFFLPDDNCYVEIKGFKTLKDEAKWSQFPLQLKILYKKDIDILRRDG